MAIVFTTEITSDQIPSDNPIHQRLFKAYVVAQDYVKGNLLEIGCGEGRGIDVLLKHCQKYTAVDKIESIIEKLKIRYPQGEFISTNIPPLSTLKDNMFDSVVSFQVIEHIEDDELYLREIFRVLKPGGIALVTTPNRKLSLTRNPWHIREYLPHELERLALSIFPEVKMKGITGNEKVMEYYAQNKQSVQKITRWDILNLQYRLPAAFLRWPYEILNRWNRNKLQQQDADKVQHITHHDYLAVENPEEALDLLLIARKGPLLV